MKKILIILSTILLAYSCTKELEELNVNKKDFASTTDVAEFTTAQQKLFTQITETNVNKNIFRLIAQYWTETTYADESNYDLKTRRIDEVKANKLAVLELYEIYTYYVLAISFGDIPYSGALDAGLSSEAIDIEILNPAFDSQESIISDLLTRLDSNVISKLNTGAMGFSASEDVVYIGNIVSWKKFANSLKLQIGMLLDDKNPTLAKTTVSSGMSGGVFGSSADNIKIDFEGAAPYTNPVHSALVLSGRDEYVPTATLVNLMNTLNDPRRDDYFTLKNDTYIVAPNGVENLFGDFSHISEKIADDPKLEAPLLTYFEIEFLIAEAIERNFLSLATTAADHYENAIKASIKYWGGTDSEASDYLGQESFAYATASGDYKEKIGIQKWIALYNRGFEAWNSCRKLDFPVLIAPEAAKTDNQKPPHRLTYPTVELSLNETNLKSAGTAIGGDELETKLFWDVN